MPSDAPSGGGAPCPSTRLLLAMTVTALAVAVVVVPGKLFAYLLRRPNVPRLG